MLEILQAGSCRKFIFCNSQKSLNSDDIHLVYDSLRYPALIAGD